MATVSRTTDRRGRPVYRINVYAGYSASGKQKRKQFSWYPPDGMSPRKAEKEAMLVALEYEKNSVSSESKKDEMSFAAFSEVWMRIYAKPKLKKKTVSDYEKLLVVVNNEIGECKLCEIDGATINDIYDTLRRYGSRRDSKWKLKPAGIKLLKEAKETQDTIAKSAGIGVRTLRAAISGSNINARSAEGIASSMHRSLEYMFIQAEKGETLSENTLRHYHDLISSMLNKAVSWGYLKESPLAQVEKPQPKKTEAAFLEVSSVRELISELNRSAPFKYLAPIQFDMLTGMRRGEILGLRWSDVCMEESILRIQNTLNYVSNGGVYADTPKNSTSVRYMKLPESAVIILQKCLEWQHWQSELLGDKWNNPDGLVFTNEFGSYIHPDTITHWFTAFAKKNGYEGIHLHSLRHTCASIMIADNVPTVAVSRYLGHAQVSTTQNIYSHMLAKAAASAADAYDKFSDLIK